MPSADKTLMETKHKREQLDAIIAFLDKGAMHEAVGEFRRSCLSPEDRDELLKPKVLLAMKRFLEAGSIDDAADAVLNFDLTDITFDEAEPFKQDMKRAIMKFLEEDELDKSARIVLAFGIKREELDDALIRNVITEVGALLNGTVLKSGDAGMGIALMAAASFKLTSEEASAELLKNGMPSDTVNELLSVFGLPSKAAEPEETNEKYNGLLSLRRQEHHVQSKNQHQSTQNS